MVKEVKPMKNHGPLMIVNAVVVFVVIILGIVSILLLIKFPSACPACQACEICEDKECPVCECSEVTCPDCPACEACPEAGQSTVYVCPDGSTESAKDDCFAEPVVDYDPITTNEDGTYIEEVSLQPSCVYGRQGGTIYFEVGSIASEVDMQVKKTTEDEFTTVYQASNLFDGYRTFTIVNSSIRYNVGDFKLAPENVYVFRMGFKFGATGQYQYSNEHIIDTREGSKYRLSSCSS